MTPLEENQRLKMRVFELECQLHTANRLRGQVRHVLSQVKARARRDGNVVHPVAAHRAICWIGRMVDVEIKK